MSSSSGCGVAEGMGAPNSSPTLSLASFFICFRLERGECCTPGPSVPPAPPACPSGWLGSLAVPAAARSRRGESSWGGGAGTAGLSPPPCVASSCWSQGHSRTAISPPRERRTRAQGLGTVAEGSVPGLARDQRCQRCPTPLAARLRAGPSPGPAPPRPDGSPFPCGRAPLRPAGRVQCRDSVRLSGDREAGGANPPATRRPAAPRPAAGARRSRRAGAGLTRPSCRRCKSPTCWAGGAGAGPR